jgi:hypothetical protein
MPSYFSNNIANKILNTTLRGQALTPITNGWLALYKNNPTANSTGTEATGGSYARQSITLTVPTNGSATNSNQITFPSMPAGVFTHWGILEDSTGNNLIYFGNFDTNLNLVVGDEVKIDANAIIVKLETGA